MRSVRAIITHNKTKETKQFLHKTHKHEEAIRIFFFCHESRYRVDRCNRLENPLDEKKRVCRHPSFWIRPRSWLCVVHNYVVKSNYSTVVESNRTRSGRLYNNNNFIIIITPGWGWGRRYLSAGKVSKGEEMFGGKKHFLDLWKTDPILPRDPPPPCSVEDGEKRKKRVTRFRPPTRKNAFR